MWAAGEDNFFRLGKKKSWKRKVFKGRQQNYAL